MVPTEEQDYTITAEARVARVARRAGGAPAVLAERVKIGWWEALDMTLRSLLG